jgi:hypothetical protein
MFLLFRDPHPTRSNCSWSIFHYFWPNTRPAHDRMFLCVGGYFGFKSRCRFVLSLEHQNIVNLCKIVCVYLSLSTILHAYFKYTKITLDKILSTTKLNQRNQKTIFSLLEVSRHPSLIFLSIHSSIAGGGFFGHFWPKITLQHRFFSLFYLNKWLST